ncbi:hypothetical protein B0O99DRAFT_746239 [Bisporella sp. PMI_857]|nr:hypothetical protein B0O99DRAFT_746239 [Bisporella sp. PMI_857]
MASGSSLYAKATWDRHAVNPFALMIPSRDLLQYLKVCCSKTSDIHIVPAVAETYDYISEIPRKANTGDGTITFFKPALDKSQLSEKSICIRVSLIESLQSRQCKMALEHRAKWKQQVTDIIKELHSHDIVWNNVHPGNSVTDKNFDAWVVDIGGGWIEESVDRKKAGTKEGDWQGVQRIFEEWITR